MLLLKWSGFLFYLITMLEEIKNILTTSLQNLKIENSDRTITIHGVVHYKQLFAELRNYCVIHEYKLNPSKGLTTIIVLPYSKPRK